MLMPSARAALAVSVVYARRAVRLRLRKGPLHRSAPGPQRAADGADRRPRGRRRVRHRARHRVIAARISTACRTTVARKSGVSPWTAGVSACRRASSPAARENFRASAQSRFPASPFEPRYLRCHEVRARSRSRQETQSHPALGRRTRNLLRYVASGRRHSTGRTAVH